MLVTRALASALPDDVAIVATDRKSTDAGPTRPRSGTTRPVQRRQADALQLPFEDANSLTPSSASSASCSSTTSRKRSRKHVVC